MKTDILNTNHIIVQGRRMHYMDFIRQTAEGLPQFEGENHKAVMKRIYKKHGKAGLIKYIKRQYLIMRSIERTTTGPKWKRILWEWFYELNYGIRYD